MIALYIAVLMFRVSKNHAENVIIVVSLVIFFFIGHLYLSRIFTEPQDLTAHVLLGILLLMRSKVSK